MESQSQSAGLTMELNPNRGGGQRGHRATWPVPWVAQIPRTTRTVTQDRSFQKKLRAGDRGWTLHIPVLDSAVPSNAGQGIRGFQVVGVVCLGER